MSNEKLEKKVGQDAGNVKKDLTNLMENRVSQLSKELDKLTGDAREIVIDTAAKVKKNLRPEQYGGYDEH